MNAAATALVEAAEARQAASHHHAVELERLAAYARECEGDEFAHLEVAAKLHISDRLARQRMDLAVELTERLPVTLAALDAGRIEEFKAKLIADAVVNLTDEQATQVEARVLDKAAEQTPAQLRNALAKAVIAVDPAGAAERHEQRLHERRVSMRAVEDGMGMLTIVDRVDRVLAMHRAVNQRAWEIRLDDPQGRTLAQIEVDVARELILGSDCEHVQVEVHLTLPLSTAMRQDEQPGEIDGIPLPAGMARDLLTEATTWRWLRTNPQTGCAEDLTYPSYQPPRVLRDWVVARDRTCRFPGCTRPARHTDCDHTTPWPDGPTSAANCGCLCRRHHRAKTVGGWKLKQLRPGVFRWTSPVDLTYVIEPDLVLQPQPPPQPLATPSS